jgi:hypothetical protein
VVYGWRAKEYANDIRLPNHLQVLEEEDTQLDRKDVRCVRYLSSGMDNGAHAVAVGFGQILEMQ